jgi:hypothetical protein
VLRNARASRPRTPNRSITIRTRSTRSTRRPAALEPGQRGVVRPVGGESADIEPAGFSEVHARRRSIACAATTPAMAARHRHPDRPVLKDVQIVEKINHEVRINHPRSL